MPRLNPPTQRAVEASAWEHCLNNTDPHSMDGQCTRICSACWKDTVKALAAYHAAIGASKGWVMVPMEPTQEQIRAAIERPHTKSEDMYHSIYRAMVGAAKLNDEK